MSMRGKAMPNQELLLGQRFEDAILYASAVTGAQKRKGTSVPYLAHPIAVCALVLEDGGDEEEAIAALFHDLAEDHGPTDERLQDIRGRFGDRVASIVADCSDSVDGPRDESDWKVRKEQYIAGLANHPPSAIRVSLADKLHNARAIARDLRSAGPNADVFWGRFNAPREDQLWYYGALVEAFRSLSTSPMVRELADTVGQLSKPGKVFVGTKGKTSSQVARELVNQLGIHPNGGDEKPRS